LIAAVVGFASLLAGAPASAKEPPHLISAGERVAQRNCAECHALGAVGASLLVDAPPFRELRRHYTRDAMAVTIEQRMQIIHPRMPLLALDVDEVNEFLDYWDSLKPAPGRPKPN
jgi:mono/diheme cytochrome c family protein